MLIALYIGLAAVVFLVATNGFLQGAKKAQIDAFLSLLWLGLIAAAFLGFGWKDGAIALVVSFGYAALLRPVAARFATSLMGAGSGEAEERSYRGLPPAWLARISKELGRTVPPGNMFQELLSRDSRKDEAERALFQQCTTMPGVSQVLAKHGLEIDVLTEVYSDLLRNGAGQWAGGHYVAASVLAYPDTLDYWLSTPHPPDSRLSATYYLVEHFRIGALLPSVTASPE